jgi:hypothetical protein
MLRIVFILFLSTLFMHRNYAQIIGGRNTYDFLDLNYSARATALAGKLINVRDNDLSLAINNPASLNPLMHQAVTFQQTAYFSGITYGYAGYAHHLNSLPVTVHGGIQHISYGKFKRANQVGDQEGEFKASEMAIVAGASYQATDNLSFGTNQKIITSYLEGYNSIGWASDWSAMYVDSSKRISFCLLLKNLGAQFTTYAKNGERQRLPFDAQFGFAHRLKYLPLRFSIIAHHLHQWNIRYDDPDLEESGFLQQPVQANKISAGEVFDNIFRHLTFNFEFLLGKKENFRIRAGYDRLRQGELNVRGFRTLSGFSAGFGVKVYKFNIDYGFSSYHIGGTMHHFGISTRIAEFISVQ